MSSRGKGKLADVQGLLSLLDKTALYGAGRLRALSKRRHPALPVPPREGKKR